MRDQLYPLEAKWLESYQDKNFNELNKGQWARISLPALIRELPCHKFKYLNRGKRGIHCKRASLNTRPAHQQFLLQTWNKVWKLTVSGELFQQGGLINDSFKKCQNTATCRVGVRIPVPILFVVASGSKLNLFRPKFCTFVLTTRSAPSPWKSNLKMCKSS